MTIKRFPLHRRRTVRRADAPETKKLGESTEEATSAERAADEALRSYLLERFGSSEAFEKALDEVRVGIYAGVKEPAARHGKLTTVLALIAIVDREIMDDPAPVRSAFLRFGYQIAVESKSAEAEENAAAVAVAQTNAVKNGMN